MNIIEKIDLKAEEKGKTAVTIWQFIKYNGVSMVATVVQLLLVNFLPALFVGVNKPLPEFLSKIFSEETLGAGNSNWGYVLPYFISMVVGNTITYMMNKKTTFNVDAPQWCFNVYLIVLVFMICVCTWVQGVIVNFFAQTGNTFLIKYDRTLSTMLSGGVMLAVMFPLQKFVLFKK